MAQNGMQGALRRARMRWSALAQHAADLYEAGAELYGEIQAEGGEADAADVAQLERLEKELAQTEASLERIERYWKGAQR